MGILKNIFSVTNKEGKQGKIYKVFTLFGIKFKFRNKEKEIFNKLKDAKQEIENNRNKIECNRNEIENNKRELYNQKVEFQRFLFLNSKYWDPRWYVKHYGYDFYNQEALHNYLNIGWKKLESPSKYFNTEYYVKKYNVYDQNPLYHYLTFGKYAYFYPDNKNNYKDKNDNIKIAEYLEYKKTRQAKGVVYTCITNNYDDLEEIKTYKYVNQDWDYVCFTDNQEQINQGQVGIWQIRPLQFSESDNTRNNRWHKFHPHILFPVYEQSIYIDANINILTPTLFEIINDKHSNIVLPKHFNNICIYKELTWGLANNVDNAELIQAELDFIKNQEMPRNYGFTENNVIYRKHHDKKIIDIMDEWWQMLIKYSKRDQFCFAYLLWKNNIEVDDITFENTRVDTDNFYVFDHAKGREPIEQ